MRLFGWFAELKPVIVNSKSGKDFRGVLWKKTGDCVVLKNSEWLTPDGAKKIDGEVIIFISEIEFVQVTG